MEIKRWAGGLFPQEIRAIQKIEKAFTASSEKKSEPTKTSSMQDQSSTIVSNPMFPWKGYAGFRYSDSKDHTGEFDLLIVTHRNIIIVELKDWNNGEIQASKDQWFLNNKLMGRSPVSVTRNKTFLIKNKLQPLKHKFTNKGHLPFIDFLVVMTGNATFENITSEDKKHTITLEEFLLLADQTAFDQQFGLATHSNQNGLNRDFHLFDGLFLENSVTPKKVIVNGYKANDLIFEHPQKVYKEFIAESELSKDDQALIRVWNFNKLEGIKSETPDGRFEIISKEQSVLTVIKKKNFELYNNCLRALTTIQKDDVTSEYYEVYELPPEHIPFNQYIGSYGGTLGEVERLNLVKLLTFRFSELHNIKVAHLDLGGHSIWLSPGKKVALSSFMSASYQSHEQNGDYKSAISVNEFPLNASVPNRKVMTSFEEDIRTLAIVSWHIFNGERLSEKSVSVFYTSLSNSDSWYVPILERALAGGTYSTANDYFEAIKSNEPSNKQTFDFDYADLKKYEKNINHSREFRENDTFILDSDKKEVYLSGEDIVSAWTKINFLDAGLGYRVLNFLQKIEKLKSISPIYLPKIKDFGIATKSSSLYVVMDRVEGISWDELALDEHLCLDAISQFITAVEHLHEMDIYYGDLNPGNIVVLNIDGVIELTITNIPEFSLSNEQKVNHGYSPDNVDEYTLEELDNYAVMHMSAELLCKLNHDAGSSYTSISKAIQDEFGDPLFGFKSLARFKQSFQKSMTQKVLPVSVTLKGNFERLVIHPDNGKLYVQIEKYRKSKSDAKVRLIGVGGNIDLIYKFSEKQFVLGFRPFLMDTPRTEQIDKSQLVLDFPIEIKSSSHNSYLSALTNKLRNNEEFHRALSLTLSEPDDDIPLDTADTSEPDESIPRDSLTLQRSKSQNVDTFQENTNYPNLNIFREDTKDLKNQTSELEDFQITTTKLWQAILDTEVESYPNIEVLGNAKIISTHDDELIIPYLSDVDALGTFSKGEKIEIITSDGENITYLGDVVLNRSTLNQVFVIKTNQKTRALSDGDVVYFRTRGDKASFGKRKAALERVMQGAGLISNLADYFDPSCTLDAIKYDINVSDQDFSHYDRSDDLNNKITLNRQQREAFIKLLQNGPLSLLQGPPGTGKTEFIAAFVHFLIEKQGVKNILLVSQSHESVNTAAERIRKHCARLNSSLDVVRFSNRERVVSAGLKDVTSRALVSEKSEIFKAEVNYRVAALAKAYGVQPDYLADLLDAELRIFSPVDKYFSEVKNTSTTGLTEDDLLSIKQSQDELGLSVRQLLEVQFEIFLGPEDDLSDVSIKVLDKLNKKYSIRPDECKKARALTKISRDLLDTLATETTNYDEFLARSRQLVTGSCVGIGLWHLGINDNEYDWVIIDEAARSIASELAIAMQCGKRILLVGDHKQLPPLYTQAHKIALERRLGVPASLEGLIQSDFARAFESPYGHQTGASLLTQYRMAPDIGRLVSEVFYEGKLENGERTIPKFYNAGPQFLKNQVTWVDTSALGEKSYHQSDKGVSIYNRCEADVIINMLKELYADQELSRELKGIVDEGESAIGVICMYAEQKRIIMQKFNEVVWSDEFRLLVKIGTVDSYQGKENRIVIISVTNSSPHKSPRFLKSPSRINVALSRAMDRLVIVGSAEMWKGKNEALPLGKVVSLMSSNGGEGTYGFISPSAGEGVQSAEFFEKYAVGDKVIGNITSITNFGIFVGLEGGIDGLVREFEISWIVEGETALVDYKKGDAVEALILSLNPERLRVGLSIKRCLEATAFETFAQKHALGNKVIGNIKSITDFGIFVSLEGGIQGFVPKSLIRLYNVQSPFELVKVGDTVEAVIMKLDSIRPNLVLSIRECLLMERASIFHQLAGKYTIGDMVIGNVESVTDYGIFVGLEGGINGLVHISEISWITKEPDPFTVANIGDSVEVIILDIDEERLRISLSIKQCLNHPYETFVERHAIGDKVIGNITNIVNYGLFVVLEGGINGLVHISQISWEVEGEEALCDYNKGDEVSTVILSLNSETKRIGLGIKQQENDPQSDHIVPSDPGSKVKAIEDIKEVKGGLE